MRRALGIVAALASVLLLLVAYATLTVVRTLAEWMSDDAQDWR